MKFFSLILFVLAFGSFSAHALDQNKNDSCMEIIKDSTNRLISKTDTLELRYLIWGCECPNWISLADYETAERTGELIKYCIYIEPKNGKHQIPEDFNPEKNGVQLIGQFYEKEDFPDELLNSEEQIAKARIFQFTEMKITALKSN